MHRSREKASPYAGKAFVISYRILPARHCVARYSPRAVSTGAAKNSLFMARYPLMRS